MSIDNPFGQLVVALVTPLTASGEICWLDLERHVEAVVQGGADALVVAGTTGESATLADVEKIQLVRAVSQVAAGRAAVVAATGTSDTARSIALSRACAAAGADGVLVVTPYYSRPTQSALLAHLWAVSDSTDLPVMLYDIPARTGVGLQLDTLVRAARHPNICAIKDATGNLGRAARLMDGCDLLYFAGDDAVALPALPALAIGATGLVGVSANLETGPARSRTPQRPARPPAPRRT